MPPDGGRVHAIHPTAIAVARCLRELGQGWVPRPSCRTLLAAYAGVRSVPRHGFRVTRPCRVADRGADGGPGCRPRTDADRCRRRRPRTRSRPSVGRAWEDAHRAVADDGQREARCHAVKRNRHRVVRGADARLLEVVLQKAPVEAGRLGTRGPLFQVRTSASAEVRRCLLHASASHRTARRPSVADGSIRCQKCCQSIHHYRGARPPISRRHRAISFRRVITALVPPGTLRS